MSDLSWLTDEHMTRLNCIVGAISQTQTAFGMTQSGL